MSVGHSRRRRRRRRRARLRSPKSNALISARLLLSVRPPTGVASRARALVFVAALIALALSINVCARSRVCVCKYGSAHALLAISCAYASGKSDGRL